jgi:hypothetical protein
MSKKRKSNRKPLLNPARKVAARPTVVKTKNGRERPAAAATNVRPRVARAPVPTVQPAAAADGRRALPFWARIPFAIADFWFSRPEPRAAHPQKHGT